MNFEALGFCGSGQRASASSRFRCSFHVCLMLESFRKYVACFRAGGNTEGGYVFGLNTNAPGDVDASDAAAKVYELGKAL